MARALGTLAVIAAAAFGAAGCGDEVAGPRIEALLPDRAAPGTLVDIVGERFSGEPRFVHFGEHRATVWFWQPRRVRVRVPQGPVGLTPVVVTAAGSPSSPATFQVEAAGADAGP